MKEYENQLENRIDAISKDVRERDVEIIRLKAALESHVESSNRLAAIKKRAIEREKLLKENYPKFIDTHAQPTTEREYGAFWALDELYWIQDYCDGFIDEEEE